MAVPSRKNRGACERLGSGRGHDGGAHPARDQCDQFPTRRAVHPHLGLEIAGLYRLPPHHLFPRAPGPGSANWRSRRSTAISASNRSRSSRAGKPPASPMPPGSPIAWARPWPMSARSPRLRPQLAHRGRRAGGQAHPAGRGFDHRWAVQDPLRQFAAGCRRLRPPRLRHLSTASSRAAWKPWRRTT